jgi:hypothetical protein
MGRPSCCLFCRASAKLARAGSHRTVQNAVKTACDAGTIAVRWCPQVEGFGQGDEADPAMLQFPESFQQVRHPIDPLIQAHQTFSRQRLA